jgi:hypothetical protein
MAVYQALTLMPMSEVPITALHKYEKFRTREIPVVGYDDGPWASIT